MTEIIRIENIEGYTQEIINGTLILTPKQNYISEEELNRTSLSNSVILKCIVKNGDEIISVRKKYRSILNDIWKNMPTQKILQTTTFNMKLSNEEGKNGYSWCEDIKMSVQGKDACKTMKEIISMINLNNYSIIISIQLENRRIVIFKKNQIDL